MKDRLITFISAAGLLICFVILVSWARSTLNSERITLGSRDNGYSFQAMDGLLVFEMGYPHFSSAATERVWRLQHPANPGEAWNLHYSRDLWNGPQVPGSVFGFGVAIRSRQSLWMRAAGIEYRRLLVQAPHWAPIVLIGIGPIAWFYRRGRRERERVSQGLCRRCGFDMRGGYYACPQCRLRPTLPGGIAAVE